MQLPEGGTVVDADGTLDADVGIENGTVTVVGDVPEADIDERTDISGKFVVPGMVEYGLSPEGALEAATGLERR